MNKKFSVVIPLFNKKNSILRALASIEEQTLLPSEVIIIDDGSTDGSTKVVDDFVSETLEVYLEKQSNRGVSVARNNGIEKAKNDLVLLLDADDYWLPTHCENLVNAASKHPNVGFFFADHFKGRVDEQFSKHKEGQVELINKPFLVNEYRKNRNLIHTSAVMFRKSVLTTDLNFEVGEKRSQDILLWLSLGFKYEAIRCINKTSVKTKDFEASQRRAKEIPAHIKHLPRKKDIIPKQCIRDVRYILLRSSLLEYFSSARFGVDLAPSLAVKLKPISNVHYTLFRLFQTLSLYRVIQAVFK